MWSKQSLGRTLSVDEVRESAKRKIEIKFEGKNQIYKKLKWEVEAKSTPSIKTHIQ